MMPVAQQQQQQQQHVPQFYNPSQLNIDNLSLNNQSSMPQNDSDFQSNQQYDSYVENLAVNPKKSTENNKLNNNNNRQTDDSSNETPKNSKNAKTSIPKSSSTGTNAKNENNAKGGSWLGKAWWYIKPGGPKAMVLPDDKKKTIVWDEQKNQYVNEDGSDEQEEEIKPPPIMAPVQTASMPTTTPNPAAPEQNVNSTPIPPPNANQYRISKQNKGSGYYSKIDVISGATKKVSNAAAPAMPSLLSTVAPPAQLPSNFFVPQPVSTSDGQQQQSFYTPPNMQQDYTQENQQYVNGAQNSNNNNMQYYNGQNNGFNNGNYAESS